MRKTLSRSDREQIAAVTECICPKTCAAASEWYQKHWSTKVSSGPCPGSAGVTEDDCQTHYRCARLEDGVFIWCERCRAGVAWNEGAVPSTLAKAMEALPPWTQSQTE